MYNLVKSRVELAIKSISSSGGRAEMKNPDPRGFSGDVDSTPLMTASRGTDLMNVFFVKDIMRHMSMELSKVSGIKK